MILENFDRILETPRYFFCQLRSAWFSCLWAYGGGPIPLGVLVLLWSEGKMLYDCPSCGFQLHAVGLSGSALTGIRSAWGFCSGCGREQAVRSPLRNADLNSVGRLVGVHRNEPVIEKGTHPVFDWKDGLKGEFTPDKVIVSAVEPVSVPTLIEELGGDAARDVWGEEEPLAKPERKDEAPQPTKGGFMYPLRLEKKRK